MLLERKKKKKKWEVFNINITTIFTTDFLIYGVTRLSQIQRNRNFEKQKADTQQYSQLLET